MKNTSKLYPHSIGPKQGMPEGNMGFHEHIMKVDEVSTWLRIPKSSLYTLCSKGEIPCTKIGKHWRFDRAVVELWFKKRVREGAR